MIPNEEALNGKFEYTGLWFRPESADRQIHGTLTYSKGDIVLTTSGSLENENPDFISQLQTANEMPRRIPIILGISTNGKRITLIECHRIGGNFAFAGIPVSKYSATSMYVGIHFESIDDIKFVSVSIQYSNLYMWMLRQPFNIDNSGREEHVLRIEYRLPDTVRAIINSDFTLEIGHGYTFDRSFVQEEFKISQTVGLIIKSETANPINKFMEIHRCFRYFLMLAMLNTVHPLSVKSSIAGDPNNTIIVFPSIQLYENIPKISSPDRMLFTFPLVSDNFQIHVQTWFALWERFHHILTVYFATLLDKGHNTIEIQFQRVAQVLESYHRSKFPNERWMSEEEYGTMINDMKTKLSDVPREVQFIERFESQGNGPNLEQRIRQLVDMCPLAFNDVNSERMQFALDVMNTRNYEAHGIENLRERAVTEPLNLIYLTHQMMALFEACLITELPFAEERRRELIVTNRNVRNFARDHHERIDTNAD